MNKNKRRLSKLLIPMLAVSAINANAMENETNVKRTKSVGKRTYRTQSLKELDKFGEQRRKINVENFGFVKRGYQGVIQYEGPALTDLKNAGYYLVGSNYPETSRKFDLFNTRIDAAGHAGSIAKYKKGDNYFAVKYEPNPMTTGIETYNNDIYHNGDNKNEDQFYEDADTLYKGRIWVTHRYDKFRDLFGTYTVSDWVNGKPIATWADELKTQDFNTKIKEIVDKGTQILNIIHDFEEKGKMNTDLHRFNLMVTKKGVVKVVDHGKYRDMKDIKNYGTNKAIATKTFLLAMSPLLQTLDLKDLYQCYAEQDITNEDYLFKHRNDSKESQKAYVFYMLQNALEELNGHIESNGKINNKWLGEFDYSFCDHQARSKLINELSYLKYLEKI